MNKCFVRSHILSQGNKRVLVYLEIPAIFKPGHLPPPGTGGPETIKVARVEMRFHSSATHDTAIDVGCGYYQMLHNQEAVIK